MQGSTLVNRNEHSENKYADEFHPILISETEDTRYFKNDKENYTFYKNLYLEKLLQLVKRFEK